jgi:hypothetical protein
MHVTKNIFDSIIGTLLDMQRKSKDGLKSHTNLVQFELRSEFYPISRLNEKCFLPPASYTLTVEEKKIFCQCLRRNGQTGRTNQILEDMLRACALKYGKSWDKSLPYAEFSNNNSYQASIKMAPYEALYGR